LTSSVSLRMASALHGSGAGVGVGVGVGTAVGAGINRLLSGVQAIASVQITAR